jgi:hypothetical protein
MLIVARSAALRGDYEKKGLPDPLVLTFYFSIDGEKIVDYFLRTEPDDSDVRDT